MKTPRLIVMLTYRDRTVKDAYRIFDECKNTKAEIWGFKEEPLPPAEMKELYDYMKSCGKRTALEIVAYTEQECIAGARLAAFCGVDYLMGTLYFDSVRDICRESGILYTPFVGQVKERPSILSGNVDDMIDEAVHYKEKGIYLIKSRISKNKFGIELKNNKIGINDKLKQAPINGSPEQNWIFEAIEINNKTTKLKAANVNNNMNEKSEKVVKTVIYKDDELVHTVVFVK